MMTMQKLTENFYDRSMELPDLLLEGAIDSHVHAGPSLKSNPGRRDPFQAAEDAKSAGMRAIVFYDQFGCSSGTAWMVSRQIAGIDIFGGLILSSCQGGLNPRAVKTALYYGSGAKFVSFGTHSTYNLASKEGRIIDGEAIPFKDIYPKFVEEELSRAIRIPLNDPLPPEYEEVFELLADHPNICLNTGHVSSEEVMRILDLAERYGIRNVLIAHVARLGLTLDQQKEAAKRGALLEGALIDWMYPHYPRTHYYIEREYMDEIYSDAANWGGGLAQWAKTIRDIGPEYFVLGTDYGIRAASPSVEGMRTMISSLLDMEFTPEEIRVMTGKNPAKMLGLE
jgi:hypothetical protein